MDQMIASAGMVADAGLVARSDVRESVKVSHRYDIECHDKDGNLKWVDSFENLVTYSGLQKYLDATLKTGLAAPAWYVGLVASGTYAIGDSAASHAGWTEFTAYSESTRVAWTPGSITSNQSPASVSNSASKAQFTINADTQSVAGCFFSDNSAKSGNTGTLLSEGAFTGGTRSGLMTGDTLSVTVTATMQ